MTRLNDTQKQLLFDYSFGLTGERESTQAEDLLSSNEEAAYFYDLLKSALGPLESLDAEPCPDDLAERTILRLKEQAQSVSGPNRLDQLLAAEQRQAVRIRVPFWRNWAEVAAVAAVLVLVVSILFPAFGFARQRHLQSRCQSNFGDLYGGVASYVNDHDGQLPTVAAAPGSPWWKLGEQGPENHSNSRRAWLLVKGGYVQPGMFLCPARRETGKMERVELNRALIAQFNDFPSRAYIHYSIRIDGPQPDGRGMTSKRVFLADLNPLSERFPSDYSASPNIELSKTLLASNSRNHRERGQNVLLCDGSAQFIRTRRTSFSDDDIYSLQAMLCGSKVSGCERPASDNDTFLAP